MIEYKDLDGNVIVIDPEAQYREQSNKPLADTLSVLIQGEHHVLDDVVLVCDRPCEINFGTFNLTQPSQDL